MSRRELQALQADLDAEWQAVEAALADLDLILQDRPDIVQVRAAASVLHDLYTGIEAVFARIAVVVDGDLPTGNDWHVTLLRRMTVGIPSVRPPFIDDRLAADLDELLRFRHYFRHNYGFRLRRERIEPLLKMAPSVAERMRKGLQQFGEFLAGA
jgi:hypothetical protein